MLNLPDSVVSKHVDIIVPTFEFVPSEIEVTSNFLGPYLPFLTDYFSVGDWFDKR
jgi:hypothetical protein